MITIEELEKMANQLREQARSLNAAADAIDASLMPAKVIKDAQDKFFQAQKDLADIYGLTLFDPKKYFQS